MLRDPDVCVRAIDAMTNDLPVDEFRLQGPFLVGLLCSMPSRWLDAAVIVVMVVIAVSTVSLKETDGAIVAAICNLSLLLLFPSFHFLLPPRPHPTCALPPYLILTMFSFLLLFLLVFLFLLLLPHRYSYTSSPFSWSSSLTPTFPPPPALLILHLLPLLILPLS